MRFTNKIKSYDKRSAKPPRTEPRKGDLYGWRKISTNSTFTEVSVIKKHGWSQILVSCVLGIWPKRGILSIRPRYITHSCTSPYETAVKPAHNLHSTTGITVMCKSMEKVVNCWMPTLIVALVLDRLWSVSWSDVYHQAVRIAKAKAYRIQQWQIYRTMGLHYLQNYFRMYTSKLAGNDEYS